MSASPGPSMSSSSTARLSIGEVVALLRPEFGDLTDSKIRFLEDRKLISPARTPAGYRAFGPHDIEVLRWILTRQRDQYLPLSVIGERIARGEHLEDIWGIGATELLAAEISESEAGELRVTEPEQADQSGVTGASSEADAPADESVSAVIGSTSAGLAAAGPTAIGSAANTQPPWMAVGDEPSYSAQDLSAQSGLDIEEIEELIQFGLLVPLSVAEQAQSAHAQSGRSHAAPAPNAPVPEAPAPNAPATTDTAASTASPTDAVQATLGLEPTEPRYGGGALLIARISREFATYGLRARHLRVIRNAAVRDASVFEQSVQPVLHAGGTSTERDAQRSLSRLIALCERLRSVVFGEALRRYWR